MPRILFIDKEDRSRALLQCRLKADAKNQVRPVSWKQHGRS